MNTQNVTRRFFIGGLASFGAFGGCRVIGVPAGSACAGKPNLRFGVVSDIHIHVGAKGELWHGYGTDTLISSLEWFRDQGVDAVMIPGDLADSGIIPELEAVAAAWYQVFPNDRAPDGRRVERLFVYGNHDWDAWTYNRKSVAEAFPDEEERRRNIIGNDQKRAWERVFHEPYSRIWRKEVNGYSFVGANWANAQCEGINCKDEQGIAGVADFFAKTGAFDPARPFFYFQHPHPKNTCYGSWAWGHDNGESTQTLAKFSNAVAFSGHSHYSLTDERSIWQGEFTSIGASSLSYIGVPYDEFFPEGFENSSTPRPRCMEFDPFKAMPIKRGATRDGRQGMLVSVHDDRIVYERRDMIGGKSLGDDWVQPLEGAEPRPFAFARRAAESSAPAFPAGASLVARKERGRMRNGKETDVFALEFPAANAAPGVRAIYYKVEIVSKSGEKTIRRLVSGGYYLPEGEPKANAGETFRVAVDTLPASDGYAFVVSPVNSFGKAGAGLTAAL